MRHIAMTLLASALVTALALPAEAEMVRIDGKEPSAADTQVMLEVGDCDVLRYLAQQGLVHDKSVTNLEAPYMMLGADLGRYLAEAAANASGDKDFYSLRVILRVWERFPQVAEVLTLELGPRDPAWKLGGSESGDDFFKLVDRNHWSYMAIDYLQQEKGLLRSYTRGYFDGGVGRTRRDFADAVSRMLDEVRDEPETEEQVKIMLDTLRAEYCDQMAELETSIIWLDPFSF